MNAKLCHNVYHFRIATVGIVARDPRLRRWSKSNDLNGHELLSISRPVGLVQSQVLLLLPSTNYYPCARGTSIITTDLMKMHQTIRFVMRALAGAVRSCDIACYSDNACRTLIGSYTAPNKGWTPAVNDDVHNVSYTDGCTLRIYSDPECARLFQTTFVERACYGSTDIFGTTTCN